MELSFIDDEPTNAVGRKAIAKRISIARGQKVKDAQLKQSAKGILSEKNSS